MVSAKKPIIPIKDLVKLHLEAKFPINHIFVRFRSYSWLAGFFQDCTNELQQAGKISYNPLFRRKIHTGPQGISALNAYVTNEMSFRKLSLSQILTKKRSLLLPVLVFLIVKSKKNFGEVQVEISDMSLTGAQSILSGYKTASGMEILYALHNSERALSAEDISEKLKSIFGRKIEPRQVLFNMRTLSRGGYVVIKTKGGMLPYTYYTLRGEEEKF